MSKVKVISPGAQAQETVALGIDIPKGEINPAGYACAVRVLLQNWRQGTVGCKARSQVSLSGKKPWRQKGTGRARAGSAKSPLWRKGGVTFGPQARTKQLRINRKQQKQCLQDLLKTKLASDAVYCIDCDFSKDKAPKTKEAVALLKGAGLDAKKGVLFLSYDDMFNFAAFRNIKRLGALSFDQPNVFDLSDAQYWVFLKKDLQHFKDMVARWI